MKNPAEIQTFLQSLFTSDGSVTATAKAEPADTDTEISLTLNRKVESGLSTISIIRSALIPEDSPILPGSAFYEAILIVQAAGTSTAINLSNLGLTHFDPELLSQFLAYNNAGTPAINLSGNALPASEVNAILAYVLAEATSPGTLQLEGGTNAAPTGQGITDAADLVTAGWDVFTN